MIISMVFAKFVLLSKPSLLALVDKITKSQDKGDIMITLLIDLKKAFDTIDHRILLRKLYSYGIRGSMLKWMESYLTERSQYVVFDGKVSGTHGIKCAVPQGSILGPLLFIISVNDICNVSVANAVSKPVPIIGFV